MGSKKKLSRRVIWVMGDAFVGLTLKDGKIRSDFHYSCSDIELCMVHANLCMIQKKVLEELERMSKETIKKQEKAGGGIG